MGRLIRICTVCHMQSINSQYHTAGENNYWKFCTRKFCYLLFGTYRIGELHYHGKMLCLLCLRYCIDSCCNMCTVEFTSIFFGMLMWKIWIWNIRIWLNKWAQYSFCVVCGRIQNFNPLSIKKQTTKFKTANFKKMFSPSCIILRIQRPLRKQCRSRWGGSPWDN